MVAKQAGDVRVQVTFTMPAKEGCECLYLVGEFNAWNDVAHPMQQGADGPGCYRWNSNPAASISIATAPIAACGATIQPPTPMFRTRTVLTTQL